ncbi:unnamed protein product [Eruca vesicaria subsp. sativa]|uniref:Phorbol-ester/DAG-type domain-containing protein n=1 Tax=Eruca vesicaria subsp. sativa TaxID=29727 RepID=A0ABC8K9P9_ERUVS|nr:unnamed protein product [Eruca vesicaria subsp. sativa]
MALKCPLNRRGDSRTHEVRREYSRPPFTCKVCKEATTQTSDSYKCYTCEKEIHLGCLRFKRAIENHPYHPSHLLKLKITNSKSLIPEEWSDDEVVSTPDDSNRGGCKCCRRKLQDRYYHCDDCKFNINATCALNQPPLTIVPKKSHDHMDSFTLFPRRLALPCDACGLLLDKGNDHVYTCLASNYIAHRKCIEELPSVIEITRHIHRLKHKPSLFSPDVDPADEFCCGVCRKPVNVNYGQYSCTKGCHYAVHSKCATRSDVWDLEELYGVPEEPESETQGGVELFQWIDDETILHCNHKHHYLKYSGENNDVSDGNNFCQACLLLIVDSDSVYSCMECKFVLHKACAILPPKIPHPLHKHKLTLLPLPTNLFLIQFKVFVEGMFKCSGCHQIGCGFMYRCDREGCKFQLDVRCASLKDSFIHGSHDHFLFLSLNKGKCMRCGTNQCSPFYLECTKCANWFLGLKCAMLPSVAHYKFDKHPLTLCYGEKVVRQYWCELCETTLHSSEWFYTCDICGVTLHVTCLLGKEVYLKPDHTIKINDKKVDIVRNSFNPRPFCGICTDRCVDTLVLSIQDSNKYCCTLKCTQKLLDRERRGKKSITEE